METNRKNRQGNTIGFWLVLAVAPLIPWIAYVSGWEAVPSMLSLFSMSIFFAALLGHHQVRIPFTEVVITPRIAIIFWAAISFGALGGAMVAAAAAAAGFSPSLGRWRSWLNTALRETLCAALGGAAFSSAFELFFSKIQGIAPVESLISIQVLGATAVMFVVFESLLFVSGRLRSEVRAGAADLAEAANPRAARQFTGRLIAVLAAIALFAAFEHSGAALGLVLVPAALMGHVGHLIHIRLLDQKTSEIADASRLHLATVEALATAIDARDQVGVGHVQRTQIYAVGIGTALGLNESDLNALRAAALLHDIGKLAVPEHILNKPGRLTSAELEKTKIHSAVGASILEKVGFPYPVVPTVKHHHECWDGSGYPDGLSGDRIPITARILSVADAYDALRGPRPFRPAVGREEACTFLRSRAGSQFDPHVVNTFFRNLRQLEAEIDIHGFAYGSADATQATQSVARGSYVDQIKRANQEVFSLYEMARDFGSSLRLDETLDLLTRKIGEFVPFDTCLVYLMDEDETTATAAHTEGRNSERLLGKRVIVGEGATGYVLKKRKPVENVDPSLDFAFSHPDICEHYVGMACVPLVSEDKLIGAISVFSAAVPVYEEEHLRMLETISRIAADAISKSIKHAESEVHAQTDPLTGLPNARGLSIQFEREVARARRSNRTMQVLMLDLDGFKAVNDTFGHKTGDTMLREIGRVIRAELRDYDFLARYGGDEFVALIPETDNSDVIELCARIESAVTTFSSSFDGAIAAVGVSIGAACFPAQGESFEQLLVAADEAMYRTKAFHKQRQYRMGESTNSTPAPDDRSFSYLAEAAIAEVPVFVTPESDLVVELDESRIVIVNTVN